MHPDIAAHIAQFPEHIQVQLSALHAFILDEVPGLTQKIAYGIPTFQLNGKNFIHFAGYSKHIGLYPGAKGIAAFSAEFEKRNYKFSKGAVQFPVKEALPLDLVQDILDYLLFKNVNQSDIKKAPEGAWLVFTEQNNQIFTFFNLHRFAIHLEEIEYALVWQKCLGLW